MTGTVTVYCLFVVFHMFYCQVSSVAWLAMMMFTAVLALVSCGLLGHLLSFHIYLSKCKAVSHNVAIALATAVILC